MNQHDKLNEIENYWRRSRHYYEGHRLNWEDIKKEFTQPEGEFGSDYLESFFRAINERRSFIRLFDGTIEEWADFLINTFLLWLDIPEGKSVLLVVAPTKDGAALFLDPVQGQHLDTMLKKRNTIWFGLESLALEFKALSPEELDRIPSDFRHWLQGKVKALPGGGSGERNDR